MPTRKPAIPPGATALAVILGLASCGASPPPPHEDPAPTPTTYAETTAAVTQTRARFAAALAAAETDAARREVLAQARAFVRRTLADDLFGAWVGTPWAFHGTATAPGGEPIACGYFVATLLQAAGFELSRRAFGQATGLRIQRATTPPGRAVHRFLSIPPAKLAAKIAALGDGVYIIGLNVHVGFVVVRGGVVRLVHASYTEPRVVTDEPLADAAAIANSQASGYFVSELVTTDAAVRAWINGTELQLP